jgi:N-acyl-D-amino-acid deacylase
VNVALMVPHGSVRGEVLGMEDRAPTPQEMERMKALVRAGMEAGAFGLSSGPYYAPGSFSTTEELVELARVAAEFGGVYSSHIRDESDYTVGVVAAVDEVIRVAREAQLPGIVTHIKALGPRVWGYSQALVSRIERAREQGVEVYADQYPYEASRPASPAALVPRWAQVGGADGAGPRASTTRGAGAAARGDAGEPGPARRRGALQFRATPGPLHRGADAAAGGGRARPGPGRPRDGAGAAGARPRSSPSTCTRPTSTTLMRQPWTMTASDGDLVPMNEGVPHPRAYGTFPRKIRKYVLEEGVVDLARRSAA